MPKKKKKRKKGRASTSSQSKPVSKKQAKTELREQTRRELLQKVSIIQEKMGIRGNLLFKVSIFFPLIAGALVSKGSMLIDLVLFYLVFGVLVVGTYLGALFIGSKKWDLKGGFFYVIEFVLLLVIYGQTKSLEATVLIAAALLLLVAGEGQEITSPREVLSTVLAYLFLMCVLAVVGVYSQIGKIYPSSAIIGAIPGFVLIASIIADNSKVLLDAGWRRSKIRTQKGEEKVLPAGLTQIFTLLLLIGPMIGLSLAPLGFLPIGLILVAFSFIWIPKISKAFLDGSEPDKLLASNALKVAALLSLLTLIGLLTS